MEEENLITHPPPPCFQSISTHPIETVLVPSYNVKLLNFTIIFGIQWCKDMF